MIYLIMLNRINNSRQSEWESDAILYSGCINSGAFASVHLLKSFFPGTKDSGAKAPLLVYKNNTHWCCKSKVVTAWNWPPDFWLLNFDDWIPSRFWPLFSSPSNFHSQNRLWRTLLLHLYSYKTRHNVPPIDWAANDSFLSEALAFALCRSWSPHQFLCLFGLTWQPIHVLV